MFTLGITWHCFLNHLSNELPTWSGYQYGVLDSLYFPWKLISIDTAFYQLHQAYDITLTHSEKSPQ